MDQMAYDMRTKRFNILCPKNLKTLRSKGLVHEIHLV